MPGIIVGIDGSRHSQRALEWAIKEAALRQVPLRVLTVYRTTVGYWGEPVTYPQDAALAGQVREEAREATEKALALAGGARPESVTVDVICGIASEELISASKDADLIVVGARGTGGFARLLLGSVSSQITYHAHCPAVVIPGGDRH
jgi:nucleotide-binding universal stress UspA family protein